MKYAVLCSMSAGWMDVYVFCGVNGFDFDFVLLKLKAPYA